MKKLWNKLLDWHYRTRKYNYFKHLLVGTIMAIVLYTFDVGPGQTYFAVAIAAALWEIYFQWKNKTVADAWDILAGVWFPMFVWINTFIN